jgi:S1-C subfamily serine protease
VTYAFLGVTSQALYPQLAEHLDVEIDSGALVIDVQDDSPADDAGIRPGSGKTEFQGQEVPRGSDVIVGVDGKRLTNSSDLADLISLKNPGDRVRLELVRGDERRTVTARLDERPAQAPRR